MDEPGEREQRLVRRHVRGRLLAADVLLARLQRQHVAAVAVQIGRLADDPARQPPRVLGLRGEEAVVRAGVRLVVAGALPLPDREVGAVVPGRLEHAERDRVDVGDRERAGVLRGRGQLGRVLEDPEDVRLLEDHGGGVLGRLAHGRRVGRPALVRDLDDLEAEPDRVRLHDLPHLRVQRLREHDLGAARRVLRDEAGVRGDRRPVVAGRVRDVHPGQLADRGLVLEDRLQDALAHLGLVRRVRGQELAALQDRVDDRGDVVVVDPGAEERELLRRVDVLRGELLQVADELRLGERRLEVELTLEANPGRDVAEELLDRRDADRRQHLLAIGVGGGELIHARHGKAGTSALDGSVEPTLMLGQMLLVGGDVEEAVDLGGVGEADPHEPALAVGVLVDGLGRVDDLLVHLEDLARERRDHVRDGLDRLDLAVGGVLRRRAAVGGRLEVDELAERVLREPRHAEGRLVALDSRPVVLGVVLEPLGIVLGCSHGASVLSLVDRFRDDGRAAVLAADVDRQLGAGARGGSRDVAHADALVEHRRVRAAGDLAAAGDRHPVPRHRLLLHHEGDELLRGTRFLDPPQLLDSAELLRRARTSSRGRPRSRRCRV